MLIDNAYAQTAAGGGDLQGQIMSFLPIILIVGVFYFLLFRPQQQRAKQLKQQQTSLRRGDRVVTAGGMIGTVSRVLNDEEVEVQIAEAVKVRVIRSTIATVLTKPEPAGRDGGKTVEAKTEQPESEEDEGAAAPPTPAAKKRRSALK